MDFEEENQNYGLIFEKCLWYFKSLLNGKTLNHNFLKFF